MYAIIIRVYIFKLIDIFDIVCIESNNEIV